MFDRYFRTSAANQSIGGFGIGLSICKEYVDLLNGNIHIESEQGNGSSFIITIPNNLAHINQTEERILSIPLTNDMNSRTNIPVTRERHFNGSNKKNILVVDDNHDFYVYLSSFLKTHFNFSYARNGLEALEILAKAKPGLMITDWMMEKMDGLDLTKQIKSDVNFQSTPIIMLTARNLISDQIKSYKIGVDAFLNKSVAEEVLLSKISTLLHKEKNLEST